MQFFLFLFLTLTIFPVHSKDNPETKERIELILPAKPEKGSPWGETFKFNEIDILDKVDETSSQNRWKEANREYSNAIDGYEAQKKGLEAKFDEKRKIVYYEDRYEWQKKQRRETIEKEYRRLSLEIRQTAVNKLIKAMTLLDKIENPKVKDSLPYLDLKSGIYREYIKHQEAYKNYLQIIDFSERYMSISETNEKEAEPHRLLALAYEKMEQAAQKSKNQELSLEWKELKKKHLLRFAEIHYGRESKEFQKIEEKIGRDF